MPHSRSSFHGMLVYITAPTGEAAVSAATTQHPDIVFLDLGLPDLDGVDVIKRIRSWSNMPIIVISAGACVLILLQAART